MFSNTGTHVVGGRSALWEVSEHPTNHVVLWDFLIVQNIWKMIFTIFYFLNIPQPSGMD